MAATPKPIHKSFNLLVDDKGSAKKVREQYDLLSKSLVETSKKFASQNYSLGYQNAAQSRFIKDEIDSLKELAAKRRAAFEEKKGQLEVLKANEQEYVEKHTNGSLTDSQYEEKMKWVERDRRDVLKGTGYRKDHTYLKGEATAVDADEKTVGELQDLIKDSNSLLREILSLDREEAMHRISDMQSGTGAEKLAADRASVILEQNRLREERENGRNRGGKDNSVFSDLLSVANFQQMFNSARNTLTSNNAVDAARNLGNTAIEAGIGTVDVVADIVGGLLSKKAGGIVKKVLQVGGRAAGAGLMVANEELLASYTANQEFESVVNRNKAMTGRTMLPYDNSGMGYSYMSSVNMMNQLARSQGSSRNIESTTREAQTLDRGWNLGTEVTSALLELIRSNKETDQNLINIVGGIYSSGKNIFEGDRTFMAEFLSKNFTTLQRELLTNQASVKSGLVMDVLTQFDNIGGQFDAKHQNSSGLLSSINSSLSNPGGDTMDALTFAALKRAMPDATLGEILREREKGLGSSKYFNAFMEQLDMLGGSDDFKMIQASNAFGINYDAANTLVTNKDKFKDFSDTELKSALGGGMMQSALQNTTQIEQHTAELENARIMGAFEKVTELIDQMKDVWTKAWDGASYTVDPANGRLTVKTQPTMNATKQPSR